MCLTQTLHFLVLENFSYMCFKVLIFLATFDILTEKKNTVLKYHKNTLCKILGDLEKLSPWQKPIF